MSSGFDCPDVYAEHCFMVRLPRSANEPVALLEVFGREAGAADPDWTPECILRATLGRAKWNIISKDVRLEFNRRLRAERKRAGRWLIGDNGVQRLLGKELLVLVWAIEQDRVSGDQAQVAVRNWLGLKPEERWWLYTMTGAATGYASQQGQGWREALRVALTFGTDRDLINLPTIAERGQLPPHPRSGRGAARTSQRPGGKLAKMQGSVD